MEANMPAPMEQADPTAGMPGSEAPAAEDDPLKAMQESLSQDAEEELMTMARPARVLPSGSI
jgi:hypothetical protein